MVVIVMLKTSMFPRWWPWWLGLWGPGDPQVTGQGQAGVGRMGKRKCRRFKCFQGYGIGNLVAQPTFLSSRSNAEMHPPEADGGIWGPPDDAVFNSILGSIRALLPASRSQKYFVLFVYFEKYRALKSWRANFFKGTIIIVNDKAEDFCHA